MIVIKVENINREAWKDVQSFNGDVGFTYATNEPPNIIEIPFMNQTHYSRGLNKIEIIWLGFPFLHHNLEDTEIELQYLDGEPLLKCFLMEGRTLEGELICYD